MDPLDAFDPVMCLLLPALFFDLERLMTLNRDLPCVGCVAPDIRESLQV